MQIPKIIHYIWLGNNPIPNEFLKFMQKSKKVLCDYEFKIWTDSEVEKFYDDSEYLADATREKKYAFITDYLRLKILYEYGGIYLDTDVEVRKRFDPFLNIKTFLGYIVDCSIGTAVIGSMPKNKLLNDWISFMEEKYSSTKQFVANNHWITEYFLKNYNDFCLDGKMKTLKNGISIFPMTFFESAKPFYIKHGGYSVHFCAGSWLEKTKKNHNPIKSIIRKITPTFVKNIKNYRLHLKENIKYPYYSIWLKNHNVSNK